jgi:carbonic anhydrase
MHNYDVRKTAETWKAAQFHWHAKSEHTVDGKYFDLEMHTVHTAVEQRPDVTDNNGYIYSVLGVFFDTDPKHAERFDDWEIEIIDAMFESMQWDVTDKNPKVKELKVGDFLKIVDTTNRWTYDGSLTTPPCSNTVQWNVIRKVYPIKQAHMDLFNKQLGRQDKYDLLKAGNYREIQKIDDHNLMMIYYDRDMGMGSTIGLIVFAVLAVIFLIVSIVLYMKLNRGGMDMTKVHGTSELVDNYDTNKPNGEQNLAMK